MFTLSHKLTSRLYFLILESGSKKQYSLWYEMISLSWLISICLNGFESLKYLFINVTRWENLFPRISSLPLLWVLSDLVVRLAFNCLDDPALKFLTDTHEQMFISSIILINVFFFPNSSFKTYSMKPRFLHFDGISLLKSLATHFPIYQRRMVSLMRWVWKIQAKPGSLSFLLNLMGSFSPLRTFTQLPSMEKFSEMKNEEFL